MNAADLAALETAGVYDPAAERAEERLELLEFLEDQGVSRDEMVAAHRAGRLPLAAAERLVHGGRERLTLAEVSERTGIPIDAFRRVWLADGFPDPGETPVFSESDVEAFALFHATVALLGEDVVLQLARVIGSSLARIAEAEVAAIALHVGAPLLETETSEPGLARALVGTAEILPLVARVMDTLHRRHIDAAIKRAAFTTPGLGRGPSVTSMAVGFADLCGYSALAQRLSMEELAAALAQFDALAADIVVAGAGRVVKLIGDEVMFVGQDPVGACRIARTLQRRLDEHDVLPRIRVGLAYGELLAHDGDYYGAVVNLAARAAGVAEAGDVIVDDALQRAVRDAAGGYEFAGTGPQRLKGFAEPVELYRLIAAAP